MGLSAAVLVAWGFGLRPCVSTRVSPKCPTLKQTSIILPRHISPSTVAWLPERGSIKTKQINFTQLVFSVAAPRELIWGVNYTWANSFQQSATIPARRMSQPGQPGVLQLASYPSWRKKSLGKTTPKMHFQCPRFPGDVLSKPWGCDIF